MSTFTARFYEAQQTVSSKGTPGIVLRGKIETDQGEQDMTSTLWISEKTAEQTKNRMRRAGVSSELVVDAETGEQRLEFRFSQVPCDVEQKEELYQGKTLTKWEIPLQNAVTPEAAAKMASLIGKIGATATAAKPKPKPAVLTAKDRAEKVVAENAAANGLNATKLMTRLVVVVEGEYGITEEQFTDDHWNAVASKVLPDGM
jgi:hypothetical protein